MKELQEQANSSTTNFSMEDFFLVEKGFLSAEKCSDILKNFENVKDLSKKNKRIVEGVNKVINELKLDENIGEYWSSLEAEVDQKITPFVDRYLEKFGTVNRKNYNLDSLVLWSQERMEYSPVHYDKEWITDDDGGYQSRNFLCLLYLDDDYEGGEVLFPLQNKVVKPERGMLLIFPTSYMFPHSTTPVIGDSRHLLRLTLTFDKNTLNTKFS